jgi:hypothetical protein
MPRIGVAVEQGLDETDDELLSREARHHRGRDASRQPCHRAVRCCTPR